MLNMTMHDSTYKLNATQFDQALAVVQAGQPVGDLSRYQKVSYVLLNASVYGAVIALVLFIVVGVITKFPNEGAAWVVLTLLSATWGIFAGLTPVIVLLNLPLMRKIRRQIKVARGLGLSRIINVSWQTLGTRQKLLKILTSIAGIIGLLIMVAGLIIGVFVGSPAGPVGMVIGGLLGAVLSSGVLATYFVRRGKARLDRLTKSLLSHRDAAAKADAGRIDVPAVDYELIAELERVQIFDARQQSIKASCKSADAMNYIVQKSRSVREQLAQLEINTRAMVEGELDELMMEPEPQGVTGDQETKTNRLRVPGTQVEIDYVVDESNRRVKVISLHPSTGDTAPGS